MDIKGTSIKCHVPAWPFADEKDEEAVKTVIRSQSWWRNAGTEVKEFETEFSKYQDCEYGVSVANGTVAIEVALHALGIGEGDEVIVPAFTFYSTISAVVCVGATPVIVDVDADTFCIDPEEIKSAISDKTKAIIPVHIAGNVCDMEKILAIAKERGLFVIEDAAHAHGGTWRGRKAGSIGDCGSFSFQNAKLLTAGEGGMIVSNNKELMDNAFLFSNCGRAETDTSYQHVVVAGNARLSELQGAVLRTQLCKLDEQISLREKNYARLEKLLSAIPGITMQKIYDDMTRNPHYMVMFYYDEASFSGKSRAEFVDYLKKCGIPANRSYETLYKIPIFESGDCNQWRMVGREDSGVCTNSEAISDNVVCLAHNILLGDEKLIEEIAECIKNFAR